MPDFQVIHPVFVASRQKGWRDAARFAEQAAMKKCIFNIKLIDMHISCFIYSLTSFLQSLPEPDCDE